MAYLISKGQCGHPASSADPSVNSWGGATLLVGKFLALNSLIEPIELTLSMTLQASESFVLWPFTLVHVDTRSQVRVMSHPLTTFVATAFYFVSHFTPATQVKSPIGHKWSSPVRHVEWPGRVLSVRMSFKHVTEVISTWSTLVHL